jgi:DNA-binding transcriptional LysR family regulator
MREAGSGTRKAIERLFHEHRLEIKPRLELGSNEAIKQAILAGLGVSALSCHVLTLHQPDQFAVLDVEGFPIQRHWYAVYPAGRRISVVARAFLDYLLAQPGGAACAPASTSASTFASTTTDCGGGCGRRAGGPAIAR